MIRDPSDGTVREKPVIETGTSGLPITKAKAEYLARLEKSREWLKGYHAQNLFNEPVASESPTS